MSTPLRIFVMALAWAVFSLVTFYGCIKPTYRSDALAATATEPPAEGLPTPTPNRLATYTVATTIGSEAVLTGEQWSKERTRLLERYRRDTTQRLRIVGNYYAEEPTPNDYDNLGLERAGAVAQLLLPDVPNDKVDLDSRQLSGTVPSDTTPWLAASFDYVGGGGAAGAMEAEVVQLSEREYKIRFPFNAATDDLAAEVTDYLDQLARQLQQGDERITIIGHTDGVGSTAANQALGLRRADFVKRKLVAAGAPADRITTSSRGEADPEVPNDSERNRFNNRRVVITLLEG